MAYNKFPIKVTLWDYWLDENDLLHVIIDMAGELKYVERKLIRRKA